MDKEGWIAQLGRLYKEVSGSDGGRGANAFAEQFNRVLSNLQNEFPDNEFIQNMGEVGTTGKNDLFGQGDAIQEVKMKCGQLADALGYDLPEAELEQSGDITVVSMQSEQSQTAEQNVSQEVSIENVLEMVNYTTLNQAKQDELREIIQEFEDELSEDEPDPSRLRDFIESAKTYSVDVSAKLAMLALGHGLVGVLSLPGSR
jgi:hypothetical protein